MRKISMRPITNEGYNLMHEGVCALSRVESNGLRIDDHYLSTAIARAESEIRRLEKQAKAHKVFSAWRKRFGSKTSFGSTQQLGDVLFKDFKIVPTVFTPSGRPAADESALESIDNPFVKDYLSLKKMQKALGTYLRGIEKHTVDGYLHPIFNLHIARTFRSSSESPNFQNMPVRNEIMGELIRKCFISRFGKKGCIVELDFKGVEVSVAACYHHDPTMLSYIKDKSKDMHRDMAMQIYHLYQKQVSKKIRHAAKNKFVFPEFYGDWWYSCAQALWESIGRDKLVLPDGTSLYEHLKTKGISSLGTEKWKPSRDKGSKESKPPTGTFLHRLYEVEKDFWGNRFKVYDQWKKDWYNDYLDRGYMATHTGFVIEGVISRKEAINYPVQGSAFHCLLWSLCRVQKKLEKYKMKSVIGGQVHDSLVGDVLNSELKDYMDICQEVLTKDILKHYKWLIVPLEVEAEISPPGSSWFDKTGVHYENSEFSFTPKGTDTKKNFTDVNEFLECLSASQVNLNKAA